LMVWILDRESQKVEHVLIMLRIAACDDFRDLLAHETPIALARLDAPASPQVQLVVWNLVGTWPQNEAAKILPTIGMVDPPLAEVNFALADPYAPVCISVAEIGDRKSSDIQRFCPAISVSVAR
jgi:hypothetical protein